MVLSFATIRAKNLNCKEDGVGGRNLSHLEQVVASNVSPFVIIRPKLSRMVMSRWSSLHSSIQQNSHWDHYKFISMFDLVFERMLSLNVSQILPLLSWVECHCADVPLLVPGDFGKYSKSKSHETQIFRISPLLLPNFLGGIIFPSVSALYSHLGRRRNFQPNSSQDGHCCKFLGGEF